jgi:putative nucleotidyltransferase with HDIG domain
MQDQEKTKEQLLEELAEMRLRLEKLETSASEHGKVETELIQSLEKLKRAAGIIINVIAMTVEARDPYMAGHQKRVTDLAVAIASEMTLPEERIEVLRMASLIHDLGKISVPEKILGKPLRLDNAEFDSVKSHPEIGYQILKNMDFYRSVDLIVRQHHERLNGAGYPLGISGDAIMQEARILAVADVVEAICTHRPYRPALGTEKALKEISQLKGTLYDPEVVDACLRLFREKRFKFRTA